MERGFFARFAQDDALDGFEFFVVYDEEGVGFVEVLGGLEVVGGVGEFLQKI